MRLQPNALYLGDNGRCFCGNHAGITAKVTGRDLSGQKVQKVTPADQEYMRAEFDATFECEDCVGMIPEERAGVVA